MSSTGILHRLFLILLFSLALVLSAPLDGQAIGQITVDVNTLNVRSGPSLDAEVSTQIYHNETYHVIEKRDNWYKIKLDENQTGWVASWLVVFQPNQDTTKQVEALIERVNIRSEPTTSSPTIMYIQPNETFPVIKEEGEWIQIRINENETGWVAKWLVHVIGQEIEQEPFDNKNAYVQVPILNVRSGPDTSFDVLGKLTQGETVRVIETQDSWYQIEFENGTGWIASEYVSFDQEELEPSPDQQEGFQAEVNTTVLNVRSSPSEQAQVIGKLTIGQVVDVLETSDEWYRIDFDQQEGWIAGWFTQTVQDNPTSAQPRVTILNDGTNLRQGPGLDHPIILRANQGDTFDVTGTEGDWFQIVLDNGEQAYVAGWIVSAEGITDIRREGIEQYLKGKKVVIDAGHGGKDSGAIGSFFSTLEKVVNLQVSNRLKDTFEAAGADVVMTRSSDLYLTLQQRVDVSIQENADVFLSIHHNTHPDSRINGTITYFYSDEDRQLANEIQNELVRYNGLNDLKARKGNYFVLRENPRPSVLIEIGYLSNYNDELKIRQSRVQENSSIGILHGVAQYFKKLESES